MAKLPLLALLAAGGYAQMCTNTAHSKFFPAWIQGTLTKVVRTSEMHCSFEDCKPMFTERSACNRIFIGYHPDMAHSSGRDFQFRSGRTIERTRFIDEVYNPLHRAFAEQGTTCGNLENLSILNAGEKAGNFRAGDVLIYVANDYSTSQTNDICNTLKGFGVTILPVFVGTDINLSRLSLMAETQRSGSMNKAFASAGISFSSETSGMILPACDVTTGRGRRATGSSIRMDKRRVDAVVQFARVMAQCPGQCLATCTQSNKHEVCKAKVVFDDPPAGKPGCCGPQGPPGVAGGHGNPGPRGCPGDRGKPGEGGPPGPGGAAGLCGEPGLPGHDGKPGEPGTPGAPGQPGGEGPCGDPGREGEPGSGGGRGPPGIKGVRGAPGACGPPGAGGGKGPSGPPGNTGAPGCDGIGMIGHGDGHDEARQDLFTRALFDIMQDNDIWEKVYNIEKQQLNSGLLDIEPIKSCSCDAY